MADGRARPRPGLLRRVGPFVLPLPLAAAVFVAVPEGRLRCDPVLREQSPDGAWSLSVCPRPPFFAMPGQGGDAPGWIVLRDRDGAIRGVGNLDMLQAYGTGTPAEWTRDRVTVPLTVELPLVPARNGVVRWAEDRVWRLRAWLGWIPDTATFR